MAIDPVKIPQNVYIEDRVVGPLTLRQTMIMAGGGGVSYMLYALLGQAGGATNPLATAMCWIPFVISAIFALVKINDITLMRMCFLTLERLNKSQIRTWVPRRGLVITIRTETNEKKKEKAEVKAVPQTKIKELSALIDQGMGTDVLLEPEELATPSSTVVAEEEAAPAEQEMAAIDEQEDTEEGPLPLVVEKSRVKADQPALSDLKVFRDIFPQS